MGWRQHQGLSIREHVGTGAPGEARARAANTPALVLPLGLRTGLPGTSGSLLGSVFPALHSFWLQTLMSPKSCCFSFLPRLIRRTPKATEPWLGLNCCFRNS